MSEEEKPTIEELCKKCCEDVENVVEKYMSNLEETVKERPLASAGFILIAGIVIGALLGAAASKRN